MFNFFSQKLVTISVSDDSLVCAYFDNNKNKFSLKAYKAYKLDNSQIINLIVYNPKSISEYIFDFLKLNKLKYIKIGLILSDDKNVKIKENFGNILLNNYSHIKIANKKLNYQAQVPYYLLLQYQLIFIKNKLNLAGITTSKAAQSVLDLYLNESELEDFLDFNNHKIINKDKEVLVTMLGVYLSEKN